MLSPRTGLKQLDFPSAGRPMSSELEKHGMLDLEGFQASTFSRFSWAEMGARPPIEWY